MACIMCNVDKLRNEYPPCNVHNECDHPSLTCLRCTVSYIDAHGCCPHNGCKRVISKDSQTVKMLKTILSKQFKEYETEYTPLVDFGKSDTFINVTGLTGESAVISFRPDMTVDQLKTAIQRTLKHEKGKQKLLYQGKEMLTRRLDGSTGTLSDYNIKPNTTICLVICLFSIPDEFNKVVFDLYWSYPHHKKDYLDASCLLYSGNIFKRVIDYQYEGFSAVYHSGDKMDDKNRIGHHTIKVSLKKIPRDITHLFFTLSAWKSPNIARFPNPSLKFYAASNPGKDLCKTTFHHASNSRAVIMCSVTKNSDGCWEIFESGKLSAGNAHDYRPLKSTIKQLINDGF